MKSFKIGNLQIELPIVQGGMGVGISLSGLASAVANQGGIGVLSAAGLGVIYSDHSKDTKEANLFGLREEIRKCREATQGVIGVNIMAVMSDFAELVKTAIAEKVDIIFTGAGLPLSLPSFLKPDSVTKIAPIVSSARAAKLICDKWKANYNYIPDAIVVEGPMAGGHLGFQADQINDEAYSLENILPEVVKAVNEFEATHNCTIPIIAGGGVYTGMDIHNILSLGASAVQMGTRFVATHECDADDAFKQTYVDAKQEDVEIILSPVGMPGRAIHNSFLEKVHAGKASPKGCPFNCIKTCKVEKSPYCIMLSLYNAFKGRMQSGYAFAGSNAWRVDKILSVKELINSLKSEYNEVQGV